MIKGDWVVATSRTGHRYIGRIVMMEIEALPCMLALWPAFEVVLMPTPDGRFREVPSAQSGGIGPQYVHAHDLLVIDRSHARRLLDAAGIEWKEEDTHAARQN